MTRAEQALAPRWRSVALACVLVALVGAVILIWARIDHANAHADARADRLAANLSSATAEADLRGAAVSTLAADVRALRAQVQARGGTPVAPDPSAAVPDLPDRTEAPVPIPGPPGPPGPPGSPGAPGSPAPAVSPVPGPPGAAGATGQPGINGVDGVDGTNGTDGKDGTNGQPPAGWTWTDPQGNTYTCSPVDGFDPQAPRYTCTVTSTPSPTPSPTPPTTPPAVTPDRRRT